MILSNDGTDIDNGRFQFALESREHRDERAARLRRERAAALHRHRKEMAVLWWVLATVGVVSAACIVLVLVPGYPPETVQWATTLLTMIVWGGIGYLIGKNSKSAR